MRLLKMAEHVQEGMTQYPPVLHDSHLSVFLKSASLIVVIVAATIPNTAIIVTICRDRRLHKPPYLYTVSLCAANLLRAVLCLPFTLTTLLQGSYWVYGHSYCTLVAFLSQLFVFAVLLMLFTLAVDRYLYVVHYRFYNYKCRGCRCLIAILVGWGLALCLAFPPVLGLGTYSYNPLEAQCTLHHHYHHYNDSLGYILMFSAIMLTTLFMYAKVFIFMRAHRRLRPMLFEPTRSRNWHFAGPVANAAMLNNILNGFARTLTNLGIGAGAQPPAHVAARFQRFHRNEHLTRIFVIMTGLYCGLWVPYLILAFWYSLDKEGNVPRAYVTVATWLSHAHVAAMPVVFLACHKLHKRLSQPEHQLCPQVDTVAS